MRTRKAHAENYCSYKTLDIDFDKLGKIFSLSGKNGAGKTSFPKLVPVIRYAEAPREGEGITKFIYGVSTYGDPAVAEKMKKEKELPVFKGWEIVEHGQYLYRIIRTYNPNLSKGNHTLELQRKAGDLPVDGWEEADGAVSIGGSIAETQEMINSIFGPYKAYISSTFMNDGASGLLDTADDYRGDVSGFLLGIEDTEPLRKAAAEKRLELEKSIDQLTQDLAAFQERAELKVQAEKEIAGIKEQQTLLDETMHEKNNALQSFIIKKESLLQDMVRSEEAKRSADDLRKRLSVLISQAQGLSDLKANEVEIREQASILTQVRETIRDQQERYTRAKDIEMKISKLTQVIEIERNRILSAAKQLEPKIYAAENAGSQLEKEQMHILELNKSIAEIGNPSADIESAQTLIEAIIVRESKIKSELAQKDIRMEELRENISAISHATGCCPTCERSFADEADRKKLIEKFTNEGLKLKFEKTPLQDEIVLLAEQKQGQQSKIYASRTADRRRQDLITELAKTQQLISQLTITANELEVIESQFESFQHQLAEESFCESEAQQVQLLKTAHDQIGFNQSLYTKALQEERDLRQYETAIVRLEKADSDLEAIEQNIEKEQSILAEKELIASDYEGHKNQINLISSDLQEINSTVNELRSEEQNLNSHKINTENILNIAVTAENEIQSLSLKTIDVRKKIVAYRVLEVAYAARGIPLMQYELCLPALEDKINGSLSVLSPGWSITISAKINSRGKFTIPIETMNPRGVVLPYSQRSKGERRIIALSTLVGIGLFWADRTGAQPQQLFVDETEDGLDEDNMQKFKNTIATMADNFGQIGIISHRPELQSLAEVQITVTNDTYNGSTYTMDTQDRPRRVRVEIPMEAADASAYETGLSIIQEETGASRSSAAVMSSVSTANNLAGSKKRKKVVTK